MDPRVIHECKTRLPTVYKAYGTFVVALLAVQFFMRPEPSSFLLPLLVGFGAWNLVEYSLHRWTFHQNIARAPWNYLTFGLHTYHHAHESESEYIPVPLKLSGPVLLALIGLFYGLSRSVHFTALATIALTTNYLYFEWLHNRIHTCAPTNKISKWLYAHHLHHHHGNPRQNFGLTYPWMDILLRTKGGN